MEEASNAMALDGIIFEVIFILVLGSPDQFISEGF